MDGAPRGTRRSLIIVLAVASLAAFMLPTLPAAADVPFDQIVCNGAGIVEILGNPPGPGANQWSIAGRGSCLGDNSGTYFADFAAVGASDTLGLCDSQSSPLVQNFTLQVTITLTSTSDPANSRIVTERWYSPVTTFPIATPFVVTDGGLDNEDEYVGAGTILTHIYAQCPPLGTSAGQVVWARTL